MLLIVIADLFVVVGIIIILSILFFIIVITFVIPNQTFLQDTHHTPYVHW